MGVVGGAWAVLFWMFAFADPSSTESVRTEQLIEVLRLRPLVDRILHAAPPATPEAATGQLNVIEETMIELSRAALTLSATLARLEREESELRSAHDIVRGRHEDSVTRWNIAAVLVGNGIAIAGTAMQFGEEKAQRAGDAVTITGSTLAAAFSVVALLKGGSGRLPHPVETNLLAAFFDRPATPSSKYPDWIWRYLDTPLGGAKSIRRELVDNWIREGRSTADWVTEPLGRGQSVDGKVLADRAEMLADVRTRLASVNVDLELIWREVHEQRRTVQRCPGAKDGLFGSIDGRDTCAGGGAGAAIVLTVPSGAQDGADRVFRSSAGRHPRVRRVEDAGRDRHHVRFGAARRRAGPAD
jgi:hypothetical protein